MSTKQQSLEGQLADADWIIDRLREENARLKAERKILDKRIRNQRFALRLNWQIIEMRAQYRRAWYPSPLLRSILNNRRKNPPWWRRMMTRAIYGTSANEQLRRVFHS